MRYQGLIITLCAVLILTGSFARADTATIKNAGFIQGNIWFSKNPFFEGDTVRIYSAIINSSDYLIIVYLLC